MATVTIDNFLRRLTDSGILSPDEIGSLQETIVASERAPTAESLAQDLLQEQKLTAYQSEVLCDGESRPLVIHDYLLTEKIG